jgi:uncharacterized protein (DUF885 family)
VPKFPLRIALIVLVLATLAPAQDKLPPNAERTFFDPASYVPDLAELAATSELRDVVARYSADRDLVQRFWTVSGSLTRDAKMRAFHAGWLRGLPKIDFDRLSRQGQADYVLLRNRIEYDLTLVDRDVRLIEMVAPLLPFAQEIAKLQEDRQRLFFIKADAAVTALQAIADKLRAVQAAVGAGTLTAKPGPAIKAARQLDGLRTALNEWYAFYNGYDPEFTAKVPAVYGALNSDLDKFSAAIREKLAGVPPGVSIGRRPGQGGGRAARGGDSAPPAANLNQPLVLGEPIIGDPVGREGLLEDLKVEMIVYSPEQLIEIGNREYAWAEAEMKKAARELGFGDDWRAALEKVKNAFVPRGGQPALVRNLEIQAEKFIREHDLVTIPDIVHDTWRMNMMAPQQMRSAPFFLGGESILVSYPVEGMGDDLAAMIMKGNGPHLSHATVFHELIPGHGLQGFMAARYNPHRALFNTPFYGEGWALGWELELWDLGFHATPEDRIGALFWRMHRAARIIFTLNYQMGLWSPQRCVDFLVSNGHERYTAEGEVRGHVQNSPPTYQISYLLGALQRRALRRELVTEKKAMTVKQFNDAYLRTGPMPLEIVRALLGNYPLTRDAKAGWKFCGEVPAGNK